MSNKFRDKKLCSREKIYSAACIFLMIDQIVKLYVRHYMTLGKEIVLIPNFFSLIYVENSGAAFSIFRGKTLFLVIISALTLVLLDKFVINDVSGNKKEEFLVGMIIGGLCGNLIDRILFSSVTDFLSFTIFKYNFPIFNLADIFITIGIFLLSFFVIFDDFRKKNQ